jgi:hypothetical protein
MQLHPQQAVLLLPDEADRRTLIRSGVRELSFVSCRSADLLNQFITPNLEAVVCGPGMGLLEQRNLVEQIYASAITVVFRLELTEIAVAELVALARRMPTVRVSIRTAPESHDLASDVCGLILESDCGPLGLVMPRVAELLPAEAHRFVVAALVLGKRRIDVKSYAKACGIAPRSVQALHRRLGLPCPHRLLLWGQAFWVMWRMNLQAMGSKQAAFAGGFGTMSSMAVVLRSLTGESPMQIARTSGIRGLTDSFERELAGVGQRA